MKETQRTTRNDIDLLRRSLKREFIGKQSKVVSTRDPSYEGLQGTIMDETKESLDIYDGERVRKILKNNVSLEVFFPEPLVIQGGWIRMRPEERIKKTNLKEA